MSNLEKKHKVSEDFLMDTRSTNIFNDIWEPSTFSQEVS